MSYLGKSAEEFHFCLTVNRFQAADETEESANITFSPRPPNREHFSVLRFLNN